MRATTLALATLACCHVQPALSFHVPAAWRGRTRFVRRETTHPVASGALLLPAVSRLPDHRPSCGTARGGRNALNMSNQKASSDPDFQRKMNGICNEVVKAILRGDEGEVKALKTRLVAEKDDLATDDMSSLFLESLVFACNHDVHPDVGRLSGYYASAWKNILKFIEDAGWQLTDPPFTVTG